MPIAFECEYCGRPTRVADHLAGRRVRCPGCSEAIVVPSPVAEVQPAQDESPAPARPVRRARRPFEEEAAKPSPAAAPVKSLTLDNETQASNPGQINVHVFKYWSSYPFWPTIWFGSTLTFLVGGLLWLPLLIGAIICGLLMGLYWTRVREHFRHGCALPAIVLSVDQQLVAFLTDLSTGEGSYPAVKILQQPIQKMTGGTPKKNQRLVGVALYEASPSQNDHWATFHPKVANCVTTDEQAIQRTFETIAESDWQELVDALAKIPRKTAGLHPLW